MPLHKKIPRSLEISPPRCCVLFSVETRTTETSNKRTFDDAETPTLGYAAEWLEERRARPTAAS